MMLGFVYLSLYNEGGKIRKNAQEKTSLQAQSEMENAFIHTLNVIDKELKALSEWDEVFQQFYDPSYYFFWHDERLQETGYYKAYYDGLELYNADKTLLTPASPDAKIHYQLPDKISNLEPTVISIEHNPDQLVVFSPVMKRGTKTTIGYVGVVINLIPALLTHNTFHAVNQSTIRIQSENNFAYSEIMQHVEFEPLSNPISEYLWRLIEDFIIELIILMIIISVVLSLLFNITIYRPLDTISGYLRKIKTRPSQVHPVPESSFFLKEFEELKNTLYEYHRDLQRTQSQLDQQNQTVWEQARRDGLTNVFNRRAFDEAWSEAVESYEKFQTKTVFMLFDCDFFKALNDTYGHEVGDEVIKLTATTLQKSLPIGIATYRIGGDEFAVIIQDCDLERGIKIAENSIHALETAPFNSIGIKEKLTFSVGISNTLEEGTNDIVNLPRQADIAMYKAKESLREKIQCYQDNLHSSSLNLFSNKLVNTVIDAINTGNHIELHYQPIKSVTGSQVYYETLLRMFKDGEYIYPNDIFTIVDRRRLEIELDNQVFNQVRIALKNGVIPKNTGLSINISGKTLLQPFFRDLCSTLTPFLKDYKIVLEITENSLIDHMDYATELLNELRGRGFLIALDDFGSGYSSIRYLANMPVDIVKFDMSMTRALMSEDRNTQNIIRTTAQMILLSGYDLVMEGVEDQEMLQVAQEAGATHIQGYLLGRPQKTPSV